ncbi:enoyl-CoA hydratase [Orrella sp. 11846]|uniref:enoyl-CoA hydratase n=1 Tax=Orrella sp. 11846 TaxID=3409913 RepID=UPI003B5AE2B9
MSESLVLERVEGRVAILTLNRPKALNALNDALMDALGEALLRYDADESISVIVLTGNEKAFAAGADIAAMKDKTFEEVTREQFITRNWETILRVRKPIIAAVAGYALGGGCELAMMCDMIYAADNAKFAQPEIKLGIIPGAGGTQRLPRAVGKSKAMDLVLTGRMMDAQEAERAGLVARVIPAESLMSETMDAAMLIASMSLPSVIMAKEAVNRAWEGSLTEGVRFERQGFHSLFATHDQKEGMAAFMEKRKADFQHK